LKYTVISVPALFLGVSLSVFAQGAPASGTKVGIIHIQNAIISTKDGQKAAADLQARFAPTRQKLEKKQADVEADRAKLNQGSNAMSAEQKEKLMRDIDQKTKSLNRDTEDAQAELDQEQGKIMQELGQRIMAVIDKYAKDHGFSLILDVSSQQTPVLFASNDIDITRDIIQLYDQNSPGAVTSSAPKSAMPKPAAPASSSAPPAPGTPAAKKTTPGAK
jgi:outer membrane protein